jgi:hypothetical protein
MVMGEFDYYTNTQIAFICLGSSISVCGILYKLSMLENDDLVQINAENEVKVNDDNFKVGEDTKSF